MAIIQEYNRYRSRIWPLRASGVLWKKALAMWMTLYWLGRWVGSGDMRGEGRDKCCPKPSCLGHKKGFLDICLLSCVLLFVDGGFWILGEGWGEVFGNENLAWV